MKTITKQVIYSKEFQEKVLDRIFDRIKVDVTVFGSIRKSYIREVVKEALNDFIIEEKNNE